MPAANHPAKRDAKRMEFELRRLDFRAGPEQLLPAHRVRLIGFPFREHAVTGLGPVLPNKIHIAAGTLGHQLTPSDSERDVQISVYPVGFRRKRVRFYLGNPGWAGTENRPPGPGIAPGSLSLPYSSFYNIFISFPSRPK